MHNEYFQSGLLTLSTKTKMKKIHRALHYCPVLIAYFREMVQPQVKAKSCIHRLNTPCVCSRKRENVKEQYCSGRVIKTKSVFSAGGKPPKLAGCWEVLGGVGGRGEALGSVGCVGGCWEVRHLFPPWRELFSRW